MDSSIKSLFQSLTLIVLFCVTCALFGTIGGIIATAFISLVYCDVCVRWKACMEKEKEGK